MKTISQVLEAARRAYLDGVEVRYVHPTLYVLCISDEFKGLDDDERRNLFFRRTELDSSEVSTAEKEAGLSIKLLIQTEVDQEFSFLRSPHSGTHWLPFFDAPALLGARPKKSVPARAVHFYGYKGGQARSTVLAMIAKALAKDGYRVLAVDADIEAPSLDVLFGVSPDRPENTLMGLCGWASKILPLSVAVTKESGGCVDLLACRPTQTQFDMDFAAFALRSALDAVTLEQGIARLADFVQSKQNNYDIVLFDHRTGLASSVLPVVSAWPGPSVINVRLDGLSDSVTSIYEVLLAQNPAEPGAFVSFSLDPEDSQEKMVGKKAQSIDRLLEKLGTAIARGAEDSPDTEPEPPDVLRRFWVGWFLDRAFLLSNCPEVQDLSKANQDSLGQLREVLGLTGRKTRAQVRAGRASSAPSRQQALSQSGAVDSGWFIETDELARLFQENTPYSYVFGRKGTGKTRLYREMVNRGLGEPLLAAADFGEGGIKSRSIYFQRLVEDSNGNFEHFWWTLLSASLRVSTTTNRANFEHEIDRYLRMPARDRASYRSAEEVSRLIPRSTRRVMLIDGVETAVRASQLRDFVASLFAFLLTIQSDESVASGVVIRLFLRTDLSKTATQNIEQQTANRTLELSWNSDAIFNFVLARITAIQWFRRTFSDVCQRIDGRIDAIRQGGLPASEYQPLLLEIFPDRLRRNNIGTITFLNGYFSDAAGEGDSRAAFYPRLFENFLELVADPAKIQPGFTGVVLEKGQISQRLVLAAHASASQKFIDEIKQELYVLLEFAADQPTNEDQVNRLMESFDGLQTPFSLDNHVEALSERMGGAASEAVRRALLRMKDLGIFEERPGYPGQWRAGRLYKSALRMKYVRV